MPQAKPQSDLSGRVLGLLTFFGGIALLCVVFDVAWQLFQARTLLGPQAHGADGPTAIGLGTAVVDVLVKLLILCLLTVIGSRVTSRGIELYFAANGWADNQAHPPAAKPKQQPAPPAPNQAANAAE